MSAVLLTSKLAKTNIEPKMMPLMLYSVIASDKVTNCYRESSMKGLMLYDDKKNELINVSDYGKWHQRLNDVFAATYCHAVAIASGSGYDSIDYMGGKMELKLASIKADNYKLSSKGNIVRANVESTNSLTGSVSAKFRVYKGTSATHHTKDTALVLMSEDHGAFITGYAMPGEKIQNLLTGGEKKAETRGVTLGNFMEHGYQFYSMVPHMKWQNYESALRGYLMLRDYGPDVAVKNGLDPVKVLEDWASLADVNKLHRL